MVQAMKLSLHIILTHVKLTIKANQNKGKGKPASHYAATTTKTQKCFLHCYLSPCGLLWQLGWI